MKLIPQNEVDAAFMEELKDAISDRNATLDEVIAAIEKLDDGSGWIPLDELVEIIEGLKADDEHGPSAPDRGPIPQSASSDIAAARGSMAARRSTAET